MTETQLRAWHYDGVNALRHDVAVALVGGTLDLGEGHPAIAIGDLRPVGDRRAAAFAHRQLEGWRLTFTEPLPRAWAERLPRQEHHGGILDRIGIIPALLGGAALAVGGYFALSSGTAAAARLVPERWEQSLGEKLLRPLDGNSCFGAPGQAALETLAGRLVSDDTPVAIRVVDDATVNAAAFPGRQIVIFRGLIDQAKTPDEVAGVLAHEIGHVEQRHVMTALIRDFGISLLLGGADGGAIAQGLLTSRYSRGAEHAADLHSVEALREARISPLGAAAFFHRMAATEKMLGRAAIVLSYAASHPLSDEREALFRHAAKQAGSVTPALDAAQWRALKTICKERKSAGA